jgi:hypothetical protein
MTIYKTTTPNIVISSTDPYLSFRLMLLSFHAASPLGSLTGTSSIPVNDQRNHALPAQLHSTTPLVFPFSVKVSTSSTADMKQKFDRCLLRKKGIKSIKCKGNPRWAKSSLNYR